MPEVLRLSCPARRPVTISRAMLRRRAHTLRITDTVFDTCTTVDELQEIAKPAFRLLAKRYHPDHNMTTTHIGHSFRRMHAAYAFIMACDPQTVLQESSSQNALWTTYRQCLLPLVYTMALERDVVPLPPGWQYESRGLCR